MADSELKEYRGNCHCGLFKFSISLPELKAVTQCNCSICTRKGQLMIFPAENMTVLSGDGKLSVYEFGSNAFSHLFCPKCGSAVMCIMKSNGASGINARLLEAFDLDTLELKGLSGRDYGAAYAPPTTYPPASTAQNEETKDAAELEQFHGNCHCAAVTYTLVSKPLTERKVISCNCSLCSRNGDIFTYPPASSVTMNGKDNLTGYAFLSEKSLHSFCKTCGVSVCVQVEGEDLMPINLRTMEGLDLEGLVVEKYDGQKLDPRYVVA